MAEHLNPRLCCSCQHELNVSRWAEVRGLSGDHGYHLSCALNVVRENKDEHSCNSCREVILSCHEGLALLLKDGTNAISKYDVKDVELHVANEVRSGVQATLLTTVPACIWQISGLRCLDFTGHPLSSLPSDICKLTSLKRLVLIAVSITELPVEICSMTHLEQLLVSGCPLRRLPESIHKLVNLWDFYFDGNQLECLPDCLPPNVEGIKVSGNLLQKLPDSLDTCSNVTAIRAYANQLCELPDSIVNMNRLSEVSLQGNQICTLPKMMGNIKTLRFLSLHDNLLQCLPDSILDLPELRWLYLYNNRLKELPKGLLKKLYLERLLVEANPLSEATVQDLLSEIPSNVRVLGIDAQQASLGPNEALPACVTSGWMLPWGRLYAKLSPASQLRRKPDVRQTEGSMPKFGGDVLVVAFAASQAEPEWLGLLGQIYSSNITVEEAEDAIDLKPFDRFSRLHQKIHGQRPAAVRSNGDASRASSTAWLSAPTRPRRRLLSQFGSSLSEFDVLSLCDTGAQWYTAAEEREQLDLEPRLRELVQKYRRVLMVGVSMGGFGALSHAHLAHSVVVFGPQTDLTISHLRPGFSSSELEHASTNLRKKVHEAVCAGVSVEYHVAVDDHLAYARRLPLPSESLIVHPIEGRIARLLERAGILSPLLIKHIAKLQAPSDGGRRNQGGVTVALPEFAWDLNCTEERLLLGLWSRHGGLSTCWVSGRDLVEISRSAPTSGDWFCSTCTSVNSASKAHFCGECKQSRRADSVVVAESWKRPSSEKRQTSTLTQLLCKFVPLLYRFRRRGTIMMALGALVSVLITVLRKRSIRQRSALTIVPT
eukprot:TRINITY_DN55330_c0_g1_i1.p1 TRINITY_DN55330_c0_g1~~TRINITY_DN55330_c0_g1_i1.p1  ORF type:complete len:826 (+),score=45.49 TRINITY_DN55330_c0_g1_i1:59-2536(+)